MFYIVKNWKYLKENTRLQIGAEKLFEVEFRVQSSESTKIFEINRQRPSLF